MVKTPNKRNTVQRKIILQSIKELDIHASAEQVYEHVSINHPTISRTTVYRNLSQMAESGEILNIGNHHGATRYDHNCHEHYHFFCDDCKKAFDVDGSFSDFMDKITGMEGFQLVSCHISLIGFCPDCLEKKTLP